MSTLEAVTLAVVFVVLLAWHLTYTAARLHRLHTRAEGALAALDAQLVRRAEAAIELANAGVLDAATSLLLASAASDSLHAAADDMRAGDWTEGELAQREAAESDLTVTIGHALGFLEARSADRSRSEAEAFEAFEAFEASEASEGFVTPPAPQTRLGDAHRRVQLARRFYNDAVSDVQRLRARPLVRGFRLAGNAALPRTMEFADEL